MSHGSFVWFGGGGGSTCPAPMTRADLLTLRAASGLSTECTYTITDYAVGRLGAGTLVQLHATSVNTLSENASVLTTYDNEAWAGTYDIDANRVTSLRDNRGNFCADNIGAVVSAFDWGNAAINNCTVENGTWTQTIGSVRPMNRVRVEDGGILITAGMTAGTLTNVLVTSNATVNLTNANVSLNHFIAEQSCTVNANGYVAGSTWTNTTVRAGSILNASGTTTPLTLTRVVVEQGASVNNANLLTGSTSLQGTTISAATVTRNVGSGVLNMTSTTIDGGGSTTHNSPGTMTVNTTTVSSSGNITASGTSTSVTVQQSFIIGGTVNASAGAINMTQSRVEQLGQVSKTAGPATMSVFNSTVSGSGSNLTQTTNGTANASFATVVCMSGGFVLQTGAGVLDVSASEFHGSGRVNHQGARNLNVTRVTCSELGIITHNSATAGTDTINDTQVTTRGQVTMTQTGANATTFQWSRVSGISGTVNVTGTTGTVGAVNMKWLTADNGTITLSNTGASNVQLVTSTGSSNVTISTPASITVGKCTASESAQLNVSGATGSVNNVRVWSGGAVNVNGGSVTNLEKSFGTTLTTGAFAHTNIGHHTGTSKVLTAANANRVDYMGLAAQLV
jgi:hypothetical protein